MEQATKYRTILRGSFTRNYNALQRHLMEGKYEEAKATFTVLENKWAELKEKDKEILQLMLDDTTLEDDDFTEEDENTNDYETKYELMKVKINKLEISSGNCSIRADYLNEDDQHSTMSTGNNNSSLKLPAIKLDTFDGNLKGWLPFWGQFEIIHKDETIPTFHKFRILSQSLKEGSRAKQVVDSFPISKEVDNYNAAVEALKERFGREDLLIEVYIRELLEMIVQNSKSCQLSLADLYDKLECQLRFLGILGVTTGKSAAILCPLLESCMSEEFLRVWQRSYISDEVNDAEKRLGKFREFIKAEVQNEQRISLAMTKFGINDNSSNDKRFSSNRSYQGHQYKPIQKRNVPTAMGLLTTQQDSSKPTCIFCNLSHNSLDCFKARNMSYDEKLKIVRDSKSCYLCLKRSHSSKQCRIRTTCMICDRRHATILCSNFTRSKTLADEPNQVSDTPTRDKEGPVNVSTNASVTCDASVILPTLQIRLKNDQGETTTVRAVIDTASQRSYVLNSIANKMGFEQYGEERLCISVFGGKRSGITSHKMFLLHLSNLNDDFECSVEALGQDIICGDLPTVPSGPWIEEMVAFGVNVSDFVNVDGPIELLLGADVAGSMFTGNMKKLSHGTLVAIETYLGWTVSGKMPSPSHKKSSAALLTINMLCHNMNVSDLWRLDLLGIDSSSVYKTKDENEMDTDKFFLDTVTQNEEGRYEVCLPWKKSHPPIPTNIEGASKRLDSTRQKLQKEGFLDEYDTVFKEWESEGVIEQIPIVNEGHFLPHRHVIKPSSTTKVRPVFDASARQKNACSLNQCLERGCNLIENIPTLLHSFRLKEFGVIADIRKAFLQVSVNPDDRKYLKFLWRQPDGELISYQHNRVVFGLTSSPYLLGAVIKYHLSHEREKILEDNSKYSLPTVDTLLKCFYVDNVVTSLDSMSELETFQTEATAVMAEGKFELRGWEHSGSDTEGTTSVLGLKWNSKEDTLTVCTDNLKLYSENVTKRMILSSAHKLFDPLGVASPVSMCPKLLLKELWELKVGWDEEVPEHVRTKFLKWSHELKYLDEIRLPRWILIPHVSNLSIHVFVDASELSYATVIYIRVENEYETKVHFVQSKNRISPMKKVTIPRLELLAATIGARLFNSVKEMFDDKYDVYYWTDSSTVLAWLKRDDNWSTYVSNRVNEIRRLTNMEDWHHVPGKINPADLPSRGCLGRSLSESAWWEGPQWLYLPTENWPLPDCEFNEDVIVSEKKKSVCLTMTNNYCSEFQWYWKYFSQYFKLIRMVAWVIRFIRNCKLSAEDQGLVKKGNLSIEEINDAEIHVLKLVQKEVFDGVSDKRISSLQPFEDHLGLIRLRTKVSNRVDSQDFRFPIVLPKNHPVVDRMLRHIHEKECHIGVQGLLGITRERFWILGGRKTMRKVISSCVTCKRFTSKPLDAPMSAPPEDRVRQASAFEIVGVDLAGPIYLKHGKKAWICLFTCAVYRALHLELLTSLSTEDFLLALRRFVARRGRPSRIYSDQGTNFKGTDNLFRKIQWSKVTDYCDVNRISWKFNPPSSPWWGGWWERLVGLTKQLLRRVLRRSTLTYTEMETVLCDCESVLNSRPLSFISEGLSEPVPITPSMFIQDVRESGLPELDALESISLEKKWQHRLKLKEDFRKRFRTEYLGMLKSRNKQIKTNEINLGDIVLIGNDISKRIDWPLAKVIGKIPGKDGVIRLVRLQTAAGECLRPVQRLYPLLEGKPSIPIGKNLLDIVKEPLNSEPSYTRCRRLTKKPSKFQ